MSFLLTLSLIGSLFPAWAFAEGEQYGLKDLATAIQEAPTATSGNGWENHAKSYVLNEGKNNTDYRVFIEYMTCRTKGSSSNPQIPNDYDVNYSNLVTGGSKETYLDRIYSIQTGGVMRQTSFSVYAEQGEVICLGSSVKGSILRNDHTYTGGINGDEKSYDIVLTTPQKEVVGLKVTDDVGYIGTRDQEIAGPKLSNNPEDRSYNGYTPLTYVAPVTGEYTVVFHSKTGDVDGGSNFSYPNPNENLKISKVASFESLNQSYLVAAWDITVVNKDYTKVQPARTWAKYLSLANSTGNKAESTLDTFVLTNDGYAYHVNFNKIDPAGFIFFANNTGFTTDPEVTGTPYSLYHSFYDNDNNLKNMVTKEYVTLHHPDSPDTDTMITHRIFFEDPTQLRDTVTDSSFKDVVAKAPEATANISNVVFEGTSEGVFEEGQGGIFRFTSDKATNASIVIDFREQISALDKSYGEELAYYATKYPEAFKTYQSKYYHSIYNEGVNDWNPDWHTDFDEENLPPEITEVSEEMLEEQSFAIELAHIQYMHEQLHAYLQPAGEDKPLGSGIVELNGAAVQGENTFYWDGYDTNHQILPSGLFEGTQIHVSTEAKQGEIHFPMMDAENLGGITIQRLNSVDPNWDPDNDSKSYLVSYNNEPMVKGVIEPGKTAQTQQDSDNKSYYLLSDGSRSYKKTKSSTSNSSTLKIDTAEDIARREYEGFDRLEEEKQKEILQSIDEQMKLYGATYHHEPVDSRVSDETMKTMKFWDNFGDMSGIDIWTYYNDGASPYKSNHDFAVVRASSGQCKLTGYVFYDENQNSKYELNSIGAADRPLKDMKVRLMHEVNEVKPSADGKTATATGNKVWVPLMHTASVPKVDPHTGQFVKNSKGRVEYETKTVEYITNTDANGKYTFSSVPDGTYAVQVLLSDVQENVLKYVPSTAAQALYTQGGNRRSDYMTGKAPTNPGTVPLTGDKYILAPDGNMITLSRDEENGTAETNVAYDKFKGESKDTVYYTASTVEKDAEVKLYEKFEPDGFTLFGAKGAKNMSGTSYSYENCQTKTVSKGDTSAAPKSATFANIGYFTGVPVQYLKDYQVVKRWPNDELTQGGRSESQDITVKLYAFIPPTNGEGEQEDRTVGMGQGVNNRTGSELGSARLSAANGWSYTWENLDSRKVYYFEEYYSKRDSDGHLIFDSVYDELTSLVSVKEHLVIVGATMPIYLDQDAALAENPNKEDVGTLLYQNLNGRMSDLALSKDYVTLEVAEDTFESGIFTSYFGALNEDAGITGANEKDPYVYHDAVLEEERQTNTDADAMQYDMTYTLTTGRNDTKVVTLFNRQTFDERQYYVWLDHETKLPDFINRGVINAEGKEVSNPLTMQECTDSSHNHHGSNRHIIGLTISSLDAAGTGFQEGNSTDSFRFDAGQTEHTSVLFTANKGIYHTGTGTRTYLCEYVTESASDATEVITVGGLNVLVDMNTKVPYTGDDQVIRGNGKIIGVVQNGQKYDAVIPASTKVLSVVEAEAEGGSPAVETFVLVDLDTAEDASGADRVLYDDSDKIIGIVVDGKQYTAVKGNPNYNVITWVMTIHVYDVQPDGIFEYDPTTNMVLQSAITEQSKNKIQSWYTIRTDATDEDAIRYYSDNPRAYGRIVETKNPVTSKMEPIHNLIAVDEKGQNVLLDNKDRAGLFGRSIPVYDYQKDAKGDYVYQRDESGNDVLDKKGNKIPEQYQIPDSQTREPINVTGRPIVKSDGTVYTPGEAGGYEMMIGVPITIADTKDTIRVPRYKRAVDTMMSTCADLVGIAYSPKGVVDDTTAKEELIYFDTYRDPNKVDSSSVVPGDGTESLTGSTVNGKGGMLEARYAAGHDRGTATGNPQGMYQDHLSYVNVTFKPFGDLTQKEDDTFYYKIVVYAEGFSEKEGLNYDTLDATQGVVMYTHFTMRPKEITAAITGATLSLGGNTIDLNYYVSGVTDDKNAETSNPAQYVGNYYMSFTSGETDLLAGKGDIEGTIKDSGQTVSLQRFDPERNLVMDNTWDDTRTERLYAYTYTDLYAYQMSDPVTATLYYNSDDGFVKIGSRTYSVKEYAEDVLKAQTWVEATADSDGNPVDAYWKYGDFANGVNRIYGKEEEPYNDFNDFQHSTIGTYLQAMLVDLLNYGAAAQTYRSDNAENLANGSFSQQLKDRANRTAGLDSFKMDKGVDDTVTIVGAQLILGEGMTNDLRFTFTLNDANQKENYTLRISAQDPLYLEALRPKGLTTDGTVAKLTLKDCEEVVLEDGTCEYRVTIENIPSFFWNTAFKVAFYEGDKMVHSVSYSVNAYCNRVANKETTSTEHVVPEEADQKLKDLLLAMYNYNRSSSDWFSSEEDYKPVYGDLKNNVNGSDPLVPKADSGEQA